MARRPVRHARRLARPYLTGTVGAVCVALLASGLAVAPVSPAAAATTGQSWPETKGPGVPDRSSVADTLPLFTEPAPVWPAVGSTVVSLLDGATTVGSWPITVQPLSSADAGRSVQVQVLDGSVGQVVGGSPLSIRVSDPFGQPLTFPVQVSVNYAGFAHAFGGDYADRLGVLSSAGCILDALPCPTSGSSLPSVNDRVAKTLTFIAGPAPASAATPSAALPLPLPSVSDSPAPSPTPSVDPSASASPSLDPSSSPSPSASASPSPTGDATGGTPSGQVFTMSASGTGANTGTYTATPLAPSAQWAVGLQSGAFTYDYPFQLPPAPAGDTPDLRLSYSSGDVDGRTLATNDQASFAGLGWDLSNGYIERKYAPCSADGHSTWGDLCWQSPWGTSKPAAAAYYISFGGRTDELIETSTADVYRLRSNPGWRIQHRTGGPSANPDNDKEYWIVTTNEGDRYWFGYGAEPTTGAATNSNWTVPVFGADSGEPCYNAVATLAFCTQTWRWNLDVEVDRNSNESTYFYETETNNYARANTATTVSSYVRGGYPIRIQYGNRSGAETSTAPVKVTIANAWRCSVGVNNTDPLNNANPACATPTPTNGSSYPDSPNDQLCTSSTNCSGHYTPTFFQTKRLDWVLTQVWNGSSYDNVNRYAMQYGFPDPGDGTDPALWLNFIQRRGYQGAGYLTLPVTHFNGPMMHNRVDWNTSLGVPALNKPRITIVRNELGGRLDISYGQPDACPQNGSAASDWSAWYNTVNGHWDTNVDDCFPQYFNPGNGGGFGIFHKYLVTDVTASDNATSATSMRTNYLYSGGAAWRKEDPLVSTGNSLTWNDYRGYKFVDVRVGDSPTDYDTRVYHTFYRGMYGAPLLSGNRTDTLTDFEGNAWPDKIAYDGLELQTQTYGPASAERTSSRTVYWNSVAIPGPHGHDSYLVAPGTVRSRDLDQNGAWRYRQIDNTFDGTYGTLTESMDNGDTSVSGDEECTHTDYGRDSTNAQNTATGTYWLINYPTDVTQYSGSCGVASLLTHKAIYYDGAGTTTSPGVQIPTRGNPSAVRTYTSSSTYIHNGTTYDALGRVTSTRDGRDNVTNIAYSPATGWATTITTTNPKGWVSSISPESHYGAVTSSTDVNNKRTLSSYDALGRLTGVQTQAEIATGLGNNAWVFSYPASVSTPVDWAAPNLVTTKQLEKDLATPVYQLAYTYVDGWGRSRETQTVSPYTSGGMIFSDTTYDRDGRTSVVSSPLWNSASAGSGMLNAPLSNQPSATDTLYDDQNRPTYVRLLDHGTPVQTTSYSYAGSERTTITPPVGPYEISWSDVRGRLTTRQTKSRDASAITTATYTYDSVDNLKTITRTTVPSIPNLPPVSWSYGYDWAHRRLTSTDPDAGYGVTTYDNDSNVTFVTRQATPTSPVVSKVRYDYDTQLDRPIKVYDVTTNPNPTQYLQSFGYDLAGAKGYPAGSTSFDAATSGFYTVNINGYDNRYRPTGQTWLIPQTDGIQDADPTTDSTVRQSFVMSGTFDSASHPLTVTYPTRDGESSPVTSTATYMGNGYLSRYTAPGVDYQPTYNGIGLLYQPSWGTTSYAPSRTYTYDTVTLGVKTVTTSIGASQTGVDTYNYDSTALQQLDSITHTTGTASTYECFHYDLLQRMDHAWTQTASDCPSGNGTDTGTGTLPYSRRYSYDSANRITSANADGTTRSYAYTDTTHPHAPTTAGTETLGYDELGQLHSRTATGITSAVSYDVLGQLTASTPQTGTPETYAYDTGGNRLVRRTAAGNTLYLPGVEITGTGINNLSNSVHYYGTGGKTLAYQNGPGALDWLLNDRVASPDTVIDSVTGATQQRRYTPYGDAVTNTSAPPFTSRGFLGHTEDATGLDQVGARYYDPLVGAFTSPDPLLNAGSPLGMNPYTYSAGNPVAFSDPSGLSTCQTPAECAASGDSRNPGTPSATALSDTPVPSTPHQLYLGEMETCAAIACSPSTAAAHEKYSFTEEQEINNACQWSPLSNCSNLVSVWLTPDYKAPSATAYENARFASDMITVLDSIPWDLVGPEIADAVKAFAGMARESTSDLLTGLAGKAQAIVGAGSGPVYGTRVHAAFAAEIGALGRADLSTEVSYLDGNIVPYGTRGSVRLDVVEGDRMSPKAVYDLKTGSASLTDARIAEIRANLPPGFQKVPVLEIRP